MIFIRSLMVALSTYSIIPMPDFEWNEKNMKYAICFFPVVGIICGALVGITGKLGEFLGLSGFFVAAVIVCMPLLITGGIHMDGFMDTTDALSSHQPKEKKLEIMSDPHTGAFAVIYCGIYLLLSLAFIYEIFRKDCIFAICPVYVLSRSLSAICAVNLPNAKGSGMLSGYTKTAKRKTVNIVMSFVAILSVSAITFISPAIAIAVTAVAILWTVLYCRMVKKHFGGVTGDTAGFYLQMSELLCMAGVLIGEML